MAIDKEQAKTVNSYSWPNVHKQTFENYIITFVTVPILNMKDCYQDTKSELVSMVRQLLSKLDLLIDCPEILNLILSLLYIMSSLGCNQLVECYNENNFSFANGNLLNTIVDILPVDAKQINIFFQMKDYTVCAISCLKLKAAEILPQNVTELLFGDIEQKCFSAKCQNSFDTNLSKSTTMRQLPSRGRSGNEKPVKQPTKINRRQIIVFHTIQMFCVRGRCDIFCLSRRYASYGNSGTQQLYEETIFASLGPYANFLIAFRLLVVPALYQKYRGLNIGLDDNQYSNRRIVSISSTSTTIVFFVLGRSKVFSSRIFDEALVISSMISEQNRWSVENGLQIAYTLVFPNDCRMFLHVPIYQYGYIYRIDQKNNAIPALRFEEPTNGVFMPNDRNWSGVNISLTR